MASTGRQLKLTSRANFFTDPAFADLVNDDDADLRKRLDLFKSRALSVAGKDTEPHNLQVKSELCMLYFSRDCLMGSWL